MTISHDMLAQQLTQVQSSILDVKERIKGIEERQTALMNNAYEVKEMNARLDEILKSYGRTLENHSTAIEKILSEQAEIKKAAAISEAQKNTVLGFVNSKFIGWVIGLVSAGFIAVKEIF